MLIRMGTNNEVMTFKGRKLWLNKIKGSKTLMENWGHKSSPEHICGLTLHLVVHLAPLSLRNVELQLLSLDLFGTSSSSLGALFDLHFHHFDPFSPSSLDPNDWAPEAPSAHGAHLCNSFASTEGCHDHVLHSCWWHLLGPAALRLRGQPPQPSLQLQAPSAPKGRNHHLERIRNSNSVPWVQLWFQNSLCFQLASKPVAC